ncbi:hypothetical protein LINGRAPRIM_LOCUS3378, partial [Linum grandiflorum]
TRRIIKVEEQTQGGAANYTNHRPDQGVRTTRHQIRHWERWISRKPLVGWHSNINCV